MDVLLIIGGLLIVGIFVQYVFYLWPTAIILGGLPLWVNGEHDNWGIIVVIIGGFVQSWWSDKYGTPWD